MIDWLHPGLTFIFGALFIPLFNGKIRQAYILLLPIFSGIILLNMPDGNGYIVNFLSYELTLARVDKLSMVFGYVFVIMAFIGFIYSIHLKDSGQHVAASLYIGSSLGVIFSGDFISLFIFWEVMALSSTYLIWARKTKASYHAGLRYLLIHILGGLSLFVGIIMNVSETGYIAINVLALSGPASYFILIGFILNAAVPPFSAWLSDAYPEATITGAVFLSAFTTKTAVYVLIRVFPGTEILVWFGAIMAFYGVIFAVLANDIRRLLSYHIISQVGYMVAGVGIGTALALNGSVSHAFSHILYKGLLFMGAGAVLHMTGKSKLTELGGLYKTMPITLTLYMIGGLSISAFPLFSGFVSKSMIVTAVAEKHLTIIWLLLSVSSVGTFLHTGLKLPYFTFFGKDSGLRAKDPPVNMIIAMGIASFLCILIGVYPDALYKLLPFAASYTPYTGEHVLWTMQILLFTALGFFLLLKHLGGEPYITIDTDWFYRKGVSYFMWFINSPMSQFSAWLNKIIFVIIPLYLVWISKNPVAMMKIASDNVLLRFSSPKKSAQIKHRIQREKEIYPGEIINHWPIGPTILWITLLLLVYILIAYLVNT